MASYEKGYCAAVVWALQFERQCALDVLLVEQHDDDLPLSARGTIFVAAVKSQSVRMLKQVVASLPALPPQEWSALCARACDSDDLGLVRVLLKVPGVDIAPFDCSWTGVEKRDTALLQMLLAHPRVDMTHAGWAPSFITACRLQLLAVVQLWLADGRFDPRPHFGAVPPAIMPLLLQAAPKNPWRDTECILTIVQAACHNDDSALMQTLLNDTRATFIFAYLWWEEVVASAAIGVAKVLLADDRCSPRYAAWELVLNATIHTATPAPLVTLLLDDCEARCNLSSWQTSPCILAVGRAAQRANAERTPETGVTWQQILLRLLANPSIATTTLQTLLYDIVRSVPLGQAIVSHPRWKPRSHSHLYDMCANVAGLDKWRIDWLVFCVDSYQLSATFPRAHTLLDHVVDNDCTPYGSGVRREEDDIEGRAQFLTCWLFHVVGRGDAHTAMAMPLLLAAASFPLLPPPIAARVLLRALSDTAHSDAPPYSLSATVMTLLAHECVGGCLPHESWIQVREAAFAALTSDIDAEQARACMRNVRYDQRVDAVRAYVMCWDPFLFA